MELGKLRQIYCTLIANLGMFGLGTVVGWASTGIPSLESDFKLTTMDKAWIGSIINLGALAACLTGGFALDKFGRKLVMLFYTVPFIISWTLLIVAKNVSMIYLARFLAGFAGGFYGVAAPVFVGEISEPSIRGLLSNMYGVFMTLGFLFSYAIGTFVDWKMLSIISLSIPIIMLPLLLLVKESPRFLLQVGQTKEAKESLHWYREGGLDIKPELTSMQESIEEMSNTKTSTLSDLKEMSALKPLLICILLVVFEQFSGFAAIVAYTGQIFHAAGLTTSNNLMTIIFGIFQVLATLLSGFIVDRVGRRLLLFIGQFGMLLSLSALGAYFFIGEKNPIPEELRWISLPCLVIYIVSMSGGIGPISTTLMGELLPQNIRGIGSSLTTAILRIIAFLVAFGFPGIAESLGIYWCFWLFSVVCLLGIIFIYFWVPETKGKSLEDIRSLFLPVRNESQCSA